MIAARENPLEHVDVDALDSLSSDLLWEKYAQDKSNFELRNEIVVRHLVLAHQMAKNFVRYINQVSYGELLSAAYFGLIDAVEKFDPTRGIQFELFSNQRIKGAVGDWLRELDTDSTRQTRRFMRDRDYARTVAKSDLADVECPNEMAQRMGLTLDQYLKREAQRRWTNKSVLEIEVEPGVFQTDFDDPKADDPSYTSNRESVFQFLTQGLQSQERKIIELYYLAGITLKEVGHELSLSESRMSQLHKEVLQRIQARLINVSFESALRMCC